MIVTEKQAQDKQCRLQGRLDTNVPMCAGSGCMLWRWFDTVAKARVEKKDRRGYCGAGDKPEMED